MVESDKNFFVCKTVALIRNSRSWVLLPAIGAFCFVALYIIASFYYPGGSQFNKDSVGFSWVDNYWCNLLNEKAINGYPNTAKPIATLALIVLSFALAVFWWVFPLFFQFGQNFKRLVRGSGSIAMAFGLLLISDLDHDLVTNSASLFGLIAVAGVLYGLYKKRWTGLFIFGVLNIVLVLGNNYLYYNKEFIGYLPLVQKISFVAFLAWICWIDIKIYKLSSANVRTSSTD